MYDFEGPKPSRRPVSSQRPGRNRARRCSVGLTVCLICLMFATWIGGRANPVQAAPRAAEAPSPTAKAKARKLVKLAKRFIRQKQFKRAVATFKQAYRYWARKEIQFNIALVYLEMGAKVKAYEHLRVFLRASDPDVISRLPAPLARLRNELGVLRVTTPAKDLDIVVDGTRRGTGRAEVVVMPGEHQVRLERSGETIQKKKLRVSGGATVVWDAEAVSRPPPREGPDGPEPIAPSSDRKQLHWAWFAAAAGLAVVAGGVVVGTGVKTLQLGEDYDADPSRDLQKEGRRYKVATNVMIGVSAAAAVSAAVLAFFTRWSRRERPSAVQVRPGVSPGGASLTLDFSF
jgi:hypothetical protein